MRLLIVIVSFLLIPALNMKGIDNSFLAWNKVTLQSLRTQIERAKSVSEKNLYKNRLEAFIAYLEINENTINPNSVRYQFLQKIEKDMEGKDFYIVEANRSGEIIDIRNYVIYFDQGINMVCVYNFIDGKWKKGDSIKEINLHLRGDLKLYLTKVGLGFNQDDIIITQFSSLRVKASEYYLYTTLSEASGIKKILSLK